MDSEADWTRDTLMRLKSWGFNSTGGWSSDELFQKHSHDLRMPGFVVLHLGAYFRAPWGDMFSPDFLRAIDQAAKDQILPLKSDPNIVGWFSDNELGWWGDTLFLHYLAMPASAPGRKELFKLIRSTYRDSFAALERDWISSAKSWEELEAGGTLKLRPKSRGIRLVTSWTKALATHYYKAVKNAIRTYDPVRPILGDRYHQFWELPVLEAAKGQLDVVSTNYGAEYMDGSLTHYFLETPYQIIGKPIVIGEFYWNAMENQSGNRNTVRAFPIVQTQAQRAASTARNLEALAERNYVIGAHWFQFYDHPPKGRADGEDNNMGLVDTKGRPYPLLVDAIRGFDWSKTAPRTWRTATVVPPVPADPWAGLDGWSREQGWVKPREKAAFGDLYLAQDTEALWVGVLFSDFFDEKMYPDAVIPESERPRLTLRFPNRRTVTVSVGGKDRSPTVLPAEVKVKDWPGIKPRVILRIPWSILGGQPDQLSFAAELMQHSGAAKMTWKGSIACR